MQEKPEGVCRPVLFLHAVQKQIKFPYCFEMLLWSWMLQISFSLPPVSFSLFLSSCKHHKFPFSPLHQILLETDIFHHFLLSKSPITVKKKNIAGTSVTDTATSLSLELCGCRSWFCPILSLTFWKTHLIVFIIWLLWFCKDFCQTVIFLTH